MPPTTFSPAFAFWRLCPRKFSRPFRSMSELLPGIATLSACFCPCCLAQTLMTDCLLSKWFWKSEREQSLETIQFGQGSLQSWTCLLLPWQPWSVGKRMRCKSPASLACFPRQRSKALSRNPTSPQSSHVTLSQLRGILPVYRLIGELMSNLIIQGGPTCHRRSRAGLWTGCSWWLHPGKVGAQGRIACLQNQITHACNFLIHSRLYKEWICAKDVEIYHFCRAKVICLSLFAMEGSDRIWGKCGIQKSPILEMKMSSNQKVEENKPALKSNFT